MCFTLDSIFILPAEPQNRQRDHSVTTVEATEVVSFSNNVVPAYEQEEVSMLNISLLNLIIIEFSEVAWSLVDSDGKHLEETGGISETRISERCS